MGILVSSTSRAELTEILAARARAMSRAPLLLAAADAMMGMGLAQGWHSALRVPGICVFTCLLAISVWGLADRALEEWRAVSHRSVRVLVRTVRGAAVAVGITSGFLFLCSALLFGMGTYFR